ncbi:SixA phosphatase family protein [Roseospira navarrensis]|uniref:Histidine phosphatase family protein n=1 Tax=Roseospira navarrensis TaxID=140058 RepID=A0A7X2D2E2_9PROT|nr:histidine phosphatase family protein [Roseospira navarrensis]MQX36204.1 histidine phosphatase family protein [Roseospira navarrensis]
MKRLYLLRHAKSSWEHPNLEDHDRPLAPRGDRAGRAMAAVVAALDPAPGLVLCSTAVRACQTLALVRAGLGNAPVVTDETLYAFDPLPVRLRLAHVDETVQAVMVVGHNPAFERLAVELARGDRGRPARALRSKFPTAALAALDLPVAQWADLGGATSPKGARVVAFTRPADLPETGDA